MADIELVIKMPEEVYKGLADDTHIFVKPILSAIKNGIPLDKIRAEIERLHYHPKLDFIKNDGVVEMALDIIDKYKAESEDKE